MSKFAAMLQRAIDPGRIAGVTPIVYDDAERRGVRALQVRNAAGLGITFVIDRGLDAAELLYRGTPLTWYGPGNAARAGSIDPSADAFGRTFFGGLVTTCGLEAFGPPGTDRWGSWPQHGHVNRLPAREVHHSVGWDAEEPAIEVRGTVGQFRMFGEALRLERTWRVLLEKNRVTLHDCVYNDGGVAVPHMLLYHCNIGYPLLDDTTRWTCDVSSTKPRDADAALALNRWDAGGSPQANVAEQVFIHTPRAGQSGWATATATNAALHGGTSLALAFRPAELPALFSWRMLGFGTYVMAIEPANCAAIAGRIAANNDGTLPMIEPGEARSYTLVFTVS